MTEPVYLNKIKGFGLIELMIAIVVLTFGLLAVGQLFLVAASSNSLSGSKGSASIAAQNMLESLADLYNRNPSAEDLEFGNHGPRLVQVTNPIDGTVLNCYDISWSVDRVPDPRPGKAVGAKRASVTVTPVQAGGGKNSQPPFNKILCVSTVFGTKMQ